MKANIQKALIIFLLLIIFASIIYIFNKHQEGFESQPIISYFYLDGCGWCQKFNPEWEKFAKAVSDEKIPVTVRKINAEENKEEVEKEQINGFPHVHLVKDGKRKDFEFNRTASDLMKFVKESL
jgi:thiol-disulfide isomerase/thioredoxin